MTDLYFANGVEAVFLLDKKKTSSKNILISTLMHLQLSSKDRTNGPPPAARMQLMVKRPPDGPQISPPTLGSAISHKHRQHHKLPQTHLPSTSR